MRLLDAASFKIRVRRVSTRSDSDGIKCSFIVYMIRSLSLAVLTQTKAPAHFKSKAPRVTCMTALTCTEIFATKSAFAVVTGHAALTAAPRMVIERFGGCYLSALRLARAHLMAFVACNLRMFGVTEAHFERRHHLRRA